MPIGGLADRQCPRLGCTNYSSAVVPAEGGNVPVVVMFRKQKGKPKQDLLQVKADIQDKGLDAVFLSTNNLTYAAGGFGGQLLAVNPNSIRPCLRVPRGL